MALLFPYSLSNLGTVGAIPADGDPIRPVHFNRIFRAVTALEATLGPGDELKGNLSDLSARLDVNLRDNGALDQELICEDDPSGNSRGCYRYFDFQKDSESLLANRYKKFIRMGYTPWIEPPVFLFTIARTAADGPNVNLAGSAIFAMSEVGVRLAHMHPDGTLTGTNLNYELHWLAVSRNLLVWEGDVAWAMRPIRTGGS